jgi:hypothetical protein
MKQNNHKLNAIIGRKAEIALLQGLLASNESELVSVIGRRRVGKTFLVESVYAEHIAFGITGIQHASAREQLENFASALHIISKSQLPIQIPRSWLEAFRLLIMYLEQTASTKKKVVFLDEIPWLASHRSGFLNAFGFFWNSWAVKNNIVVVICGSAASWMIQKVVHNKGGLYNRITQRIQLQPFTLSDAELFLHSRDINLNRYQVTDLYMAIGGIPHYLKAVRKGDSVAQNIDNICFTPGGILHDEFDQLYAALFDHSENHIKIVRALASKSSGLSRGEIAQTTKIPNGGGLTKTIEELQYSGFITEYAPFGKLKRETVYRLSDEYSLFYLKFIASMRKEGSGIWKSFQQTAAFRAWSGYAFEGICLKHLPQIKDALGITGIFTTSSSFYHKGADGMDGCQIDLVIDRDDRVINLCEIKWAASEFIITKAYAAELRKKISLFKYYTNTKKQVFFTFISTYGLLENEHSRGLVDKVLTLNDLFRT